MAVHMKVKVGTFNAQNLFLRYKFLGTVRGKKIDPMKYILEGATINMLGYEVLNEAQRINTARAILENEPDILALQEVENLLALKLFNRQYLNRKYPYSLVIDGNDIRQVDIGMLSKYPIGDIRTHQYDRDAKGYIFSRDCLMADVHLSKKGDKKLTVLVNHFKSKLALKPGDDTDEKRRRQASKVAQIIEDHMGDNLEDASFVVLGDFNDTPEAECLQPLLGRPWLENVVARLDKEEQWTHYWDKKKTKSHIDFILLSKALSENNRDTLPTIERRGLADYAKAYDGPRFPGVGPKGTQASDHCPVYMEIEV
jgi:endonuclease/exonuclease/phosphatase family metal-dependent hydrolase